jgi:5-methylcytosine-specific restriction endonuclease McrA
LKPSPEFQLEFLGKIQRLFSEGDFTATYKFALLISIADLAVELGSDDNSPIELSYREISLKFIQLFWQQTVPFKEGHVLVQNNGSQAAIVKAISAFRSTTLSPTFLDVQNTPKFNDLINKVTTTVKTQPIQYMQNIGGGEDVFLFIPGKFGLTLLPGVTYCLRRFHPLVQQLSRSHWIAHIKDNKQNSHFLSEDNDLESFLFETSRQTLTKIATGLRKLGGMCHYCGGVVKNADVDHFIPRSLYPRDIVQNFVLAHRGCNRSKSDTLAAKQHLYKWLEFVNANSDSLLEIGQAAGIITDKHSMDSVAKWGYTNAATVGSKAWIKASEYEPIDQTYINLWN